MGVSGPVFFLGIRNGHLLGIDSSTYTPESRHLQLISAKLNSAHLRGLPEDKIVMGDTSYT